MEEKVAQEAEYPGSEVVQLVSGNGIVRGVQRSKEKANALENVTEGQDEEMQRADVLAGMRKAAVKWKVQAGDIGDDTEEKKDAEIEVKNLEDKVDGKVEMEVERFQKDDTEGEGQSRWLSWGGMREAGKAFS